MALWTDVVTPAELTGYARAALEDYERSMGSLARWLPNRQIPDIIARFVSGRSGLQPVAEYRSYDAEAPIGALPGGQRVTVELPAVGLKVRVSEYDQLRARGADSNELILSSLERATTRVVGAVSDRVEVERGKAIETAALAIDENGFKQTGTWSRSGSHTVTASVLWSTPATAKPLDDLTAWRDLYIADNGEAPGGRVFAVEGGSRYQSDHANTNRLSSRSRRRMSAGSPSCTLAALKVTDRSWPTE